MKVMVIGGGGREHALVQALKVSPEISRLYVLPGNGGMEQDGICVPIGAKDLDGIVRFAQKEGIEFAVVAPDDPLVLGAVDRLEALGIPCFGPNRAAAVIEGSKAFAKELMEKYHIPTAGYRMFTDMAEALSYLQTLSFPAVIKADGLALGKGVVIAQSLSEGESAVRSMMEEKVFGESGSRIVIEDFLTGPEVSVLCFTDGETLVPMVSSMDHKRALDGDQGLNTGGMGTVAPNPYYTEAVERECMKTIFLPTIRAMKAEGRPFRGCLYFGLMLTPNGPKVIEYNCRFGDPETQVVLPLMKSDLFSVMRHVATGTLSQADVAFSKDAACCVIVASGGYPKSYQSGYEITMPQTLADNEHIYIAGAKREGDRLVTAGGRVLGAVATAPTLQEAIDRAYRLTEKISFQDAHYRKDIGQRALLALQ